MRRVASRHARCVRRRCRTFKALRARICARAAAAAAPPTGTPPPPAPPASLAALSLVWLTWWLHASGVDIDPRSALPRAAQALVASADLGDAVAAGAAAAATLVARVSSLVRAGAGGVSAEL